jgi:FKBP-type peptidyl-prolyl cis-trans isomerase
MSRFMQHINKIFGIAVIILVVGVIAIPFLKPIEKSATDEQKETASEVEESATAPTEAEKIQDSANSKYVGENSMSEAQQGSDLKITDDVIGTGAEAMPDKTVTVHYTGMFMDRKKFDSSLDRGTPFKFVLGGGQVIQGWDVGILGMKVGGKRTLVIPPHLAYGERGAGDVIPPNSTLLFEVELLGVE